MAAYRLLEMHAREIAGETDEWLVWLWKTLPAGEAPLYHLLTGARAPEYRRGKFVGHTNWRARDTRTERTVMVTVADHARWAVRWSLATGLCHECGGDGLRPQAGRTPAGGISPYSACRGCRGTGEAKREAS